MNAAFELLAAQFARVKSNRMSESQTVDDRTILRASPPDILLTNYQMLDLLLLRPDDYPLWSRKHDGDGALSGRGNGSRRFSTAE